MRGDGKYGALQTGAVNGAQNSSDACAEMLELYMGLYYPPYDHPYCIPENRKHRSSFIIIR